MTESQQSWVWRRQGAKAAGSGGDACRGRSRWAGAQPSLGRDVLQSQAGRREGSTVLQLQKARGARLTPCGVVGGVRELTRLGVGVELMLASSVWRQKTGVGGRAPGQ